jgi:hypothetical protein
MPDQVAIKLLLSISAVPFVVNVTGRTGRPLGELPRST